MASSSSLITSLPSSSLFKFPPSTYPTTLPPPDFELPFHIPEHIFKAALDPKVPITIAAVYAITAKLLNAYNKSTGKKPWAISKTRGFYWFVVAHNVFLAVYSAWTFVGMFKALRSSIANPTGPDGWAGTADSFCKVHGHGGLGNAAFYNETQGQWVSPGSSYLNAEGEPSRVDAGRLWNQGLAFYGWIFYLSKFYEVLDTLIILAKGKLSSTLQTYHHAGAMMAMWAGIRYMSAPIWMFCFVNSFIHAMMYTYYTITAFNIKVPTAIKRSLTTMQITQFLVGATYAMAHSFISYQIPVRVPVAKAAASSISSVASAATTAAASTGLLDNLKEALFGAVTKASSAAAASPSSPSTSTGAKPNTAAAFEITYETVPCITSSGETFAIWLNVVYLAPLTYLFVSFFIASYLRRSNAEAKRKGKMDRRESGLQVAEKAGWDAAKEVTSEVYGEGKDSAVVEDGEVNGQANGKPTRGRPNGRVVSNGRAKKH